MTHKNETHETRMDTGEGILGLRASQHELEIAKNNPPVPLTETAIKSEEAFIRDGQGEIGDPIIDTRAYLAAQKNKYPKYIDTVDLDLEDGEVVKIVDRDGIEVRIGDVAVNLSGTDKPTE